MKRFSLFSILFLVSTLLLFDSQVWAIVLKMSRRLSGFSLDSNHYIYLESTQNSVTKVPIAKIQILNVDTNSCVSNGCLETDYNRSVANLTPKNAEDNLLSQTAQIRRDLGLNQLKLGRRLPNIYRSVEPDGTETKKFLVSTQKEPLQIRLEQNYIPSVLSGGTSDVDRASMRLIINYNYRQLTLGKLNNYREAVRKYSIREVRLSPDGTSAVVLINANEATYNADLQTTLVYSFPL
ncbi:DUF2259 domain-containing protein [Lyngbya aestuarii]|uniref:DUF2259 domain-containing protein n=1 Tax=Lyngbya aestuarii TaxID=118322 RepID=UPI00403DAA41